jgi:hypothetical protein
MLTALILTIIGIILAIFGFFIISRHLESAIFWAILLGPAVGNAIVESVSNILEGNYPKAVESLRFLPCFLAAIDQTFFADANQPALMLLGGILLFLWVYVLSHFAIKRFGIWGLPIIPAVIYFAGSNFPSNIGLVNLRLALSQKFPFLSPLVLPWYGVPMLILLMGMSFLFSYFLWKHRYTVEVPMPQRFKFWEQR